MNATKNIFDLEKHFKENYNYQFVDMADLLKQPFVEYEGTGANAVFWINIDGEKYLFKNIKENDFTWFGELISKEIADILEIPCAEYKVCKLKDTFGILSKKFTKINETIILGAQLIQESLDKYPYLKNDEILKDEEFLNLYNIPENILGLERKIRLKYIFNNLNNIEELFSLIDIYFDIHSINKNKIQTIINYLVQLFLFDVITFQADRHIENWGIIKNQDTLEISTCHLFDNSASYGLWESNLEKRINTFYNSLNDFQRLNTEKQRKQFINTFYKDRLLLTPSEEAIKNAKARKRANNLEVIEYFLKYSSEEYINLFNNYLEKMKNTNFENIITKIEQNQNVILPNELKKYIIDVNNWNLYFLEEKLNIQLKKGRGRNE